MAVVLFRRQGGSLSGLVWVGAVLFVAAMASPSVPKPLQPTQTTPFVINTWPWPNATRKAWDVLSSSPSSSSLDAVVAGCTVCEEQQCAGSVGFGGSPDEQGETTLDAMVMDGNTMDVGAVGTLRDIKNAIGVARAVMDHTQHTLLAGSQATDFAVEMGFPRESLETPESKTLWEKWKTADCQPNSWRDVLPDPTQSCGPYTPSSGRHGPGKSCSPHVNKENHDTIAMIALDASGRVAVGTSTNGASHKVPGRVGDSPIMGAGAFADSDVGGCGATGDGDVMMRFLPCYHVVELMRHGVTPTVACEEAMARIVAKFPTVVGALVAANKKGEHGGAAHGWTFQYCVRSPEMEDVEILTVPPKRLA